ncbi:hypothetical protein JTB14_000454 [Gonioctena quinquepunctata]|nr:hypothetical protein JTB14_000454 [Gonioctena quinquepunctata]
MSFKDLSNLVSQFPNAHQSRILKLALRAFSSPAQDNSSIIANFSREANLPKEEIYTILGAYIALIKVFLENSDNEDEITTNLINSHNTDFGKLLILKWRIDISLSNSSLVKKVPMNLLLSLTLKNGKKYRIKVDAKEFHRLRFNIAVIFKEMNSLKLGK